MYAKLVVFECIPMSPSDLLVYIAHEKNRIFFSVFILFLLVEPTSSWGRELEAQYVVDYEVLNFEDAAHRKIPSNIFHVTISNNRYLNKSHTVFTHRRGQAFVGNDARIAQDVGMSVDLVNFHYSENTWVDIGLLDGGEIFSVEDVTLRSLCVGLVKERVDHKSVRILVPYNESGCRFYIGFRHHEMTVYADQFATKKEMLASDEQRDTMPNARSIYTEFKHVLIIVAEP